MAQILETDIGEIEFPDSFTAEQIQEWAFTELPRLRQGLQRGPIAETPARIGRDLAFAGAEIAKGTATGLDIDRSARIPAALRQLGLQAAMFAEPEKGKEIVEAADEAAKVAREKLVETREERLQDSSVYKFGERTKEAARQFYAVNPDLEQTPRAKIIQGLASTAPVLAAGVTGPAAPIVGTLAYAAMTGQQGAEDAIAKGKPDKADAAYLANAGLGAVTESAIGYPIRLLRYVRAARRAKVPPKDFGKTFKSSLASQVGRVAREVGQGASREATQEALEQAGQNVSARLIGYDPEREIDEGVWESALYGGLVGGILGLPVGVQMARDELPKNQLGKLLEDYGVDDRAWNAASPAIIEAEAQAGGRPIVQPIQVSTPDVVPPAPVATPQPEVVPEPVPAPVPQPAPPSPPTPPARPAPEPVNAADLLAIGRRTLERYQSIPDLPERARSRLPILRRLVARYEQAPTDPAVASDLASILDLRFDPSATQFPQRYREVEGGRLSRRAPTPGETVTKRRRPQDAQQVSVARAPDAVVRAPERPPVGQTPPGEVSATEGSPGVPTVGQPPTVPEPEVAPENVLHTFENQEDGMRSFVSRHEQGFSVSLQDVDSGEFTGAVRIFPTEDEAVEFARTVFTPQPKEVSQDEERRKEKGPQEGDVLAPEAGAAPTPPAAPLLPETQSSVSAQPEQSSIKREQIEPKLNEVFAVIGDYEFGLTRGQLEGQPRMYGVGIRRKGTSGAFERGGYPFRSSKQSVLKEWSRQEAQRGSEIQTDFQAIQNAFTQERDAIRKRKLKQQEEQEARQAESERTQKLRNAYDAEVSAIKLPKGNKQPVSIPVSNPSGESSTQTVPMTVYGPLAIRKTEGSQSKTGYKYFVTHVPTGLGLGNDLRIPTLEKAKQYVKGLTHSGVDLRKTEFSNEELRKLFEVRRALFSSEDSPPPDWWSPKQESEGLAQKDWTQVETDVFREVDTRYSDELDSGDVGTMLQAIRSRSTSMGARRLAARLEELGISPSVTVLSRDQMDSLYPEFKGANGIYFADRNTIVIADDVTNQEQTFLHEMVHAATVAVIRSNTSEARELNQLFTAAQRAGLGTEYGLNDVFEFVAEAFSNESFQQKLSTVNAPLSLWQRFVRAVRRILGLQPRDESVLDQIMRLGPRLMTAQQAPETRPLPSLPEIFSSQQSLEEFVQQPTVSPDVAEEMRAAGGAAAGLVSDAIADQIVSIDTTETVGLRQATLLAFVLRLRNLAPVQQIRDILSSNIPENVKDAAVSVVLRHVEHVRNKASEYQIELEKATKQVKRMAEAVGRINRVELEQQAAREISQTLLRGYREYLQAQAALLPADVNIAAQQQAALNRMTRIVSGWEQTPDAVNRAIGEIARQVQNLPVDQGIDAVIREIREKGLLQGKVSQEVIDFLTIPPSDTLQPVLANPEVLTALADLRRVQERAGDYQKQLAEFEEIFAGEKTPSPVQLRRWAERYRVWRNRQQEAARTLARFDREYRQADEDLQVYSGAVEILEQLQQDTQFRDTYGAALDAGNVLYTDIAKADDVTRETIYVGPSSGKEYRIDLRPDRIYDDQAVRTLQDLVTEVDEWLEQPDIDPLLERTWRFRRDYIRRWLLYPQFGATIRAEIPTRWGNIPVSPFEWARKTIMSGHFRGPRTELEFMDYRGANDAIRWFQLADQVGQKFRQLRNHPEYGDAAISNAIIKALKSHGWEMDRIAYWDRYVLNPILASQQSIGQLRLKAGKWHNGIQITEADMEVAQLQKRYTNQALAITQKGAFRTPLQFFNPLQIQDKFAGLNISRNAFGTGPLTMARVLGNWGASFSERWSALKSSEEKLNLVMDGEDFYQAVWAYITETNPEFTHKSPHGKLYRELSALAAEEPDYNFTSLSQTVEWLAGKAVEAKIYETTDEAIEQVEAVLVADIDAHVKAFLAIKAEQNVKAETKTPEAASQIASAANSFTKPRVSLAAPSSYFSYSLSEDVQRTSYLASGYQIFQLNQINALSDLLEGLKRKQSEMESKIDRLYAEGASRKQAIQTVQLQSQREVERQETRFNYKRLVEYSHTIERILKDLSELVIDQRTPFDGVVLYALSRGQSTLSSSLLANLQSIANNSTGGAVTAQFLFQQNLGRASVILTPPRATKEAVKTVVQRALTLAPANTAIGKAMRSNLPGFKALAEWMLENQAEALKLYAEGYQFGLVNPADTRGRSQAAGELKSTAGRVEFADPPALAKWINFLESQPGLRRFLIELRDKSPRVVDDMINLSAMSLTRKSVFDKLKKEAITAFMAREAIGRSNDFSNPDNLLEPGELGFKDSSGYRDLTYNRQVFSSAGLLDQILLDYYERWKAAPDGEKSEVPLFRSAEEEAGVVFDVAAMTNMPTAGYTPPIMQGVGYKGVVKGLAFMFMNYPLRFAERMDRLIGTDRRDPNYWRKANAVYGAGTLMMVLLLLGMAARELGQEGVEVVTGRSTSQVRLANVLADPDSGLLMRYAGIAMASNFPYYGELMSRLLGNPAYRSMLDLTEMIPVAGLIKDASIAGKRIVETQTPMYAATDFISRWFPPASPALRFFPELSGDITARNASRALTAVAPRDMDLVRDRSTGGVYRQTPATVAVRSLVSAAYRGDADAVQEAYERAVREREELGSADPIQATMQSISAQTPSRRVFGRQITPSEEARLLRRMSRTQREDYLASKNAFDLINRTIGANVKLIKEPEVEPLFIGRRERRSAQSRLPGLTGSRSRSPFGTLQIQGLQSRRRNPAFAFSD